MYTMSEKHMKTKTVKYIIYTFYYKFNNNIILKY
jgi:hypothetical protein